MTREITICKYRTDSGVEGCAIYKPTEYWQNFTPRFASDRECQIMEQTPVERMTECIKTRFPDASVKIINRKPWN